MQNDKITPFMINVAQEVLSDLQLRLKNTRCSYQMEGTGWDAGTDLDYLKQLVAYWQTNFEWRKQEAALNQSHHFKTKVGDRKSPWSRTWHFVISLSRAWLIHVACGPVSGRIGCKG